VKHLSVLIGSQIEDEVADRVAMCRGRLNMNTLFLVVLLLALEGCQGSGRFEATQVGPFPISNGTGDAAN
jgi:hypothetical protein